MNVTAQPVSAPPLVDQHHDPDPDERTPLLGSLQQDGSEGGAANLNL